ncbi:CPBP family intramembrane glutamic endopeptidase [Pseudoflavonifractor phocaeensis]|uniref:CPBP family intramembrane glutamic endopeptidase n=1 Tax=Pseudoflavonifractor phocaeensis TaxID=1870988 RepID=UPI00210B0EB0|nr:CPBP family intramembrane glutamic endopeptidase [Pseudoflavonifractor phocaeensis]MCQ4863154.1 CPBP family intramembrane metalloprotease [Pseudoflavonifractor phocaeensis]
MKKAHYKKSIIALLVVLMYLLIAVAFAKILPLAVLQDLTNSNIKRRILYDAIQAAAVIPFATTYFRSADFRKTETPSKWIPWGLIGVCAILVTIILPERVYAFWFYLIIVGCGEEFVFRGYLHRELRKAFNFKVSVILGGLVFGFAHGYSHFMVLGGPITGILSELGGGIVGALVFSAIYEKSNSIGWPILIHACLDFAGYLI